jgi:hypothetical protein
MLKGTTVCHLSLSLPRSPLLPLRVFFTSFVVLILRLLPAVAGDSLEAGSNT